MQLDDSLRTIKSDITVIILLNTPPKNHWIIKRWFNLIDIDGLEGFYLPVLKDSESHNTEYIPASYVDNAMNLNETTKSNFERYKETNPDHYYSMIKGYVSDGKRGRIFKNWKPITDAEFEALPYPSFYGLDFGFTNHPTACTEIKEHNEDVYVREIIYETGLINKHIAEKLGLYGVSKDVEIIADNAEPKSIAEIVLEGYNVVPAIKGSDSIRAGVDFMLTKNFYYTENSKNIAMEKENYVWALDKNKEPTNDPVDDFNHAMDSIRYPLYTKHVTPEVNIRWL